MKLILLLLLAPSIVFSQSKDKNKSVNTGHELYKQLCQPCHDLDHKIIGPSLRGIHLKRDNEWLHKWIKSSQSLVAIGDTAAINLFTQYYKIVQRDFDLTAQEIDDILYYIKSAPEKRD